MHPLDKFVFCPACGSKHFEEQDAKSKRCHNCGFEYYINPSAACAAFIENEQGELLVLTRKKEPAKGTLDLPGGFADIGENIEQAMKREVKEETGLDVIRLQYLYSFPNVYMYSAFPVQTLDFFFAVRVKDTSVVNAADDAASYQWLAKKDIHTEQFGLRSVRQALYLYLK